MIEQPWLMCLFHRVSLVHGCVSLLDTKRSKTDTSLLCAGRQMGGKAGSHQNQEAILPGLV